MMSKIVFILQNTDFVTRITPSTQNGIKWPGYISNVRSFHHNQFNTNTNQQEQLEMKNIAISSLMIIAANAATLPIPSSIPISGTVSDAQVVDVSVNILGQPANAEGAVTGYATFNGQTGYAAVAVNGDANYAGYDIAGAATGYVQGDLATQSAIISGAVNGRITTPDGYSVAGPATGTIVVSNGQVASVSGAYNGCVTMPDGRRVCQASNASTGSGAWASTSSPSSSTPSGSTSNTSTGNTAGKVTPSSSDAMHMTVSGMTVAAVIALLL